MNHEAQLVELKRHLQTIEDLRRAAAVLNWDQATYMPPGGAEARGRQLALLSRLAHERMTDPQVGRLLDALAPWAEAQGSESDVAALLRVTRRDYERAICVPSEFIQRLSEHTAALYTTWERARPANDFAAVRPGLEKTVDLSRELASFFPRSAHPYDPLIDRAEDGMTVDAVRSLFSELRAGLVPLIERIRARPEADDGCLRGNYPESMQQAFGEKVVRAFGYDYTRGRQDKTAHPFMTKLGRGDVRITTRYQSDYLADGLFATMHEAGHALYEQGIDDALEGTPLFRGTTSGVHESQSRLWENLVGRSLPFWRHWYGELQEAFPDALNDVNLGTFYRAINKVIPSLVRTRADEVTYNLHVMLRFDLELDLLEGRLSVADLPDAWRSRLENDLGVSPPDDRDGVMQDVHWYDGVVGGAFQSYTLGNIMSAQFLAAAKRDLGDLDEQIGSAEFTPLRQWLTDRIYRHGRKFTAPEVVERATGEPLSITPYLGYLEAKYGSLYEL